MPNTGTPWAPWLETRSRSWGAGTGQRDELIFFVDEVVGEDFPALGLGLLFLEEEYEAAVTVFIQFNPNI